MGTRCGFTVGQKPTRGKRLELRLIAGQKPVSDVELTGAKTLRIRGYAQQFESLEGI